MTMRQNNAPAVGVDPSSASLRTGLASSRQPGILDAMWRYKIFIATAVLISTAVAAILTFVIDAKYQASVTLSPVSDDSSGGRLGGLASIASQLSGLGGIGIGGPGATQKQESLATLQSEALTERYINDNNLLPVLYDTKWDAAQHRWKKLAADDVPTLWKANQFFRRHVRSVANDTKTGLTTMTITWKDPHEAADWANGLVKLTNDFLRTKAIDDSERNIAYLKDQLSKTNVIGVQTAFNSLLENEMKKAMLAQGNREYALKVIDPAFPPEKRSSPIPELWLPMGFLLGLISSTVIVYLRVFRPFGLQLNETRGNTL